MRIIGASCTYIVGHFSAHLHEIQDRVLETTGAAASAEAAQQLEQLFVFFINSAALGPNTLSNVQNANSDKTLCPEKKETKMF